MKEKDEKHPIDGLFAKKLRNISVLPAADGFARLQTRMGKSERKGFLTVWQNPTIVRYAAAAACLLLISAFGWQFWHSREPRTLGNVTVATNETARSAEKKELEINLDQNATTAQNTSKVYTNDMSELAQNYTASPEKATRTYSEKNKLAEKSVPSSADLREPVNSPNTVGQKEEAIAQSQPKVTETRPATEPVVEVSAPPAPAVNPQTVVAQTASKPEKTSERVLVVTIAEPPTLAAARQAAANAKLQPEEKTVVAQAEKPGKENKPANLWQQLRRVREGDVFASRTDGDNADRGLFERAYRGVKHSIETNKAQKND